MVLVLAVAACGGSGHRHLRTHSRTVIHIDRELHWTALTKSVAGVSIGTRAAEVRSRFGPPLSTNDREGKLTCWWYNADQADTSTDGVGFCMNVQQRVARIIPAVHG